MEKYCSREINKQELLKGFYLTNKFGRDARTKEGGFLSSKLKSSAVYLELQLKLAFLAAGNPWQTQKSISGPLRSKIPEGFQEMDPRSNKVSYTSAEKRRGFILRGSAKIN